MLSPWSDLYSEPAEPIQLPLKTIWRMNGSSRWSFFEWMDLLEAFLGLFASCGRSRSWEGRDPPPTNANTNTNTEMKYTFLPLAGEANPGRVETSHQKYKYNKKLRRHIKQHQTASDISGFIHLVLNMSAAMSTSVSATMSATLLPPCLPSCRRPCQPPCRPPCQPLKLGESWNCRSWRFYEDHAYGHITPWDFSGWFINDPVTHWSSLP